MSKVPLSTTHHELEPRNQNVGMVAMFYPGKAPSAVKEFASWFNWSNFQVVRPRKKSNLSTNS